MNTPLVSKRNPFGGKIQHEGDYIHSYPNRRARRSLRKGDRFINNSTSFKTLVVGTNRYRLMVQWAVTKKGELNRVLHKLLVR